MWQIKAFIILAKLCRVGLTPGEPTLTDEGLDELDADLSFLVWKERQLVPSGELKRRDASGRTGEGVVCVLHPEELWLLEVRQCSLSTDLYNSLSLSLSIVSAWPRCTLLLAGKRGGMTVPTGEPESKDWKGQTNCGTSLPRPQFPRWLPNDIGR